MKKKVAIFANGWSGEFLELVLEGVKRRAAGTNVDLYAFVNYSSGAEDQPDNIGEKSMFELPELTMFDGVILLTNTINLSSERAYLNDAVVKLGLPAVSLEYQLDGIPFLYTDTYSGIFHLVSHLTKDHQVRNVIYVSGPADNIENQNRMRAVEDALTEVGCSLSPEQILYGNWSYYDTYNLLTDWLKAGHTLPDAFVCANDEMAIAACAVLDQMGINVPEQVIVTGCDCIKKSQELYPILSTVVREWDQLGYDALDHILQQMDGVQVTDEIEYKSIAFLGESCGCKVNELRKENRRRAIIRSQKAERESSMNEWHLRHIDDMLAKITNVTSLKDHLGWNFAYNHTFEGANFLVCLVDGYFSDNEVAPSRKSVGYTEQMEVFVHLKDGQATPGVTFRSKDLLPPIQLDESQSHFYLFIPLHVEDKSVGYAIFIDELKNLYNQTLYTWARHVSQDLDRVHQSIRLEELNKKLTLASMTDALTGLSNRTGYDALAFPCLQRCQQEGKLGAMIFADINSMKLINDQYGHLQGDIAICTVADALKMTMPSDWIAVRFGGDEFILVGECQTEQDAEALKNQLATNLNQLKQTRDLCFPLSVSFGAVVIHPGENYSLEEYLRKADEAMYVMKQQVHAAEANR